MVNDPIENLQARFSDLLNYEADDPTSPIDPLTWRSPEGDACIHYAAMRGDQEAIRMLISLGANPNAKGDMNNTPLHYATQFAHNEAAQTLVDLGADRSLTNDFGKAPGAE